MVSPSAEAVWEGSSCGRIWGAMSIIRCSKAQEVREMTTGVESPSRLMTRTSRLDLQAEGTTAKRKMMLKKEEQQKVSESRQKYRVPSGREKWARQRERASRRKGVKQHRPGVTSEVDVMVSLLACWCVWALFSGHNSPTNFTRQHATICWGLPNLD